MNLLIREGSFRNREKQSMLATAKRRQAHMRKVASETLQSLKSFEDNLRAIERAALAKATEDLPGDMEERQRTWGRPQTAESEDGDRHRPSSQSRSTSEPSRRRSKLIQESEAKRTDVLAMFARPLSPLSFYTYGSISNRPRSLVAQQKLRRGDPLRPEYRTSVGFYSPGTSGKHGFYGDKLLEPVLLPTLRWDEEGPALPVRWHDEPSDVRPLAVQELQAQSIYKGKPTMPSNVRGTVTSNQRALRSFTALDKMREEAIIEQAFFENGVWEGKWRDPLLDTHGKLPMHGPVEEFCWLSDAAEKLASGIPAEDLDLTPSQVHAVCVLVELDHVLRTSSARITDLFRAENQGPGGMLEASEFYHGLLRLGVKHAAQLTEVQLWDLMCELDPSFDGTVSVPFLGRALKAVRAPRIKKAEWQGKKKSDTSLRKA